MSDKKQVFSSNIQEEKNTTLLEIENIYNFLLFVTEEKEYSDELKNRFNRKSI